MEYRAICWRGKRKNWMEMWAEVNPWPLFLWSQCILRSQLHALVSLYLRNEVHVPLRNEVHVPLCRWVLC